MADIDLRNKQMECPIHTCPCDKCWENHVKHPTRTAVINVLPGEMTTYFMLRHRFSVASFMTSELQNISRLCWEEEKAFWRSEYHFPSVLKAPNIDLVKLSLYIRVLLFRKNEWISHVFEITNLLVKMSWKCNFISWLNLAVFRTVCY